MYRKIPETQLQNLISFLLKHHAGELVIDAVLELRALPRVQTKMDKPNTQIEKLQAKIKNLEEQKKMKDLESTVDRLEREANGK